METEKITDTRQIKIGDVFIYTGKPRGTGMLVPEIGTRWAMQHENDIISLSIEMIERGRGWEREVSKPENK